MKKLTNYIPKRRVYVSQYKQTHPFEKREAESRSISCKYPDRVPVVCERFGDDIPLLDKNKYLVPKELTVSQFHYVIRKRLSLRPDQTIFFYVKENIPTATAIVGDIYEQYKDSDGFLYFVYTTENAFGDF